jgi:hypothetical protein
VPFYITAGLYGGAALTMYLAFRGLPETHAGGDDTPIQPEPAPE